MKNEGANAGKAAKVSPVVLRDAKKRTLKRWLADKYSERSQAGYRYGIRIYLEAIGGEAVALTINYGEILGYVAGLRKQNLKVRTLKNYVFAVKIYHHFLCDTGRRTDHPCRRLRLRDLVDRSIRIDELYTPEELDKLSERAASKIAKLTGRNRVIIGLLVHQALMVSEVVALKVGDVKLEEGTIYVAESASNRARTLPLLASQIMALHEYIERDRLILIGTHPEPGRLIVTRFGKRLESDSISRLINGKTKGKRYLPKRIRQSVIAHKLKAGHDLRVVQAFAGHRQISSTEAYKQDDLEELKAGIARYHPLK